MALPNFHVYYWAANIHCIMLWLHFKIKPTAHHGLRWSWVPAGTSPLQHCLALHSHFPHLNHLITRLPGTHRECRLSSENNLV